MTLKRLFIFAAAYWALGGLFLQVAPELAFGLAPDTSPNVIANLRVPASLTFALALLNWLARDAEASRARHAIVVANIVAFALAAVGDTMATLLPGADQRTWLFVAINLLFAAGFLTIGRSTLTAHATSSA